MILTLLGTITLMLFFDADGTRDVICEKATVRVDIQSVAVGVGKSADIETTVTADGLNALSSDIDAEDPSKGRGRQLPLEKVHVSGQLLTVAQKDALLRQQIQLLPTTMNAYRHWLVDYRGIISLNERSAQRDANTARWL